MEGICKHIIVHRRIVVSSGDDVVALHDGVNYTKHRNIENISLASSA